MRSDGRTPPRAVDFSTKRRTCRRAAIGPWLAIAATIILAGCASLPRTPYTAADAASSRVLNLDDVRRYADEPATAFRGVLPQNSDKRPLNYLALSGGAADGAYGAGVLNGWSATGTRPEFAVVSGVSTGALIAPFAFLGPDQDATLRDVYTSGVAESILETPNPLTAIFGSGLFGNSNLRSVISRYVGQELLNRVADAYAKGRRLYVVTTDLDTQRTVIWDMGRIASVGSPQALELFRDVMAASASVPVILPPILIDAQANGHHFKEMHVDGSVTTPVLTLPEAFLLRNERLGKGPRLNMYILINNKIEREFQLVPNRTIDIAARSTSAVTKSLTRSILNETYDFARRSRFGFNVTYIDREVEQPSSPGFDTAYMRRLFDYGYRKARSGEFWVTVPPHRDVSPNEKTMRRSAAR